MSVSSMTGFSRTQGSDETCVWGWEAKSVNGKGLDVRMRLPRGFDDLDAAVRDGVAARFKRGNINLNLDVTWTRPQTTLAVNAEVLDQVIKAAQTVQGAMPTAQPPRVDGLLGLRGVLEQVDTEPSADDHTALEAALNEGLVQALDQLHESRNSEGVRMGGILRDQLSTIERLTRDATGIAALQPGAIRQRLNDQVNALVADFGSLDPERLAQETALVMVKADVREELDRLVAHSAAARDLLGEEAPKGRRLDFLCQEFNREANTLCSKSADSELTRTGLELKATIEQFREQVQNIE